MPILIVSHRARSRARFLVLLLATACSGLAATRIGVGRTDITPPLGMPMAGYYHERGADGVLDPLYSKAMVLDQDGEQVALVVLDLIGVTRWVTDEARVQIEQTTGIKPDHVMISATHAHTGPELSHRGKRSAEMGSETAACVAYTESLPTLVARSVRLASERLQPTRLSAAIGRCEGLTFNRRYFMRDGTTGWNPGKVNPNVIMPAGPTDPELQILYAEPPQVAAPSQAIATYVNFAMHPDTTGGSKFSADWPGALARVLAGYHGTNHFTLVANSTCGNLNHIDTAWRWPQGGPGEQNRIAAILGAAVFQSYKDLKPIQVGPLRARSKIVSLELPDVTDAQVADARKTVDSTKDDTGGNFMKLVRAYRALDVAARQGKPHQVEIQVISLGQELAWVALPGEIFVELGLALKKQSPFAHTFVVELANENIGYVPDRRSFAEGNYEPESARCAAGSGEKLVQEAAKLLAEVHQSSR